MICLVLLLLVTAICALIFGLALAGELHLTVTYTDTRRTANIKKRLHRLLGRDR